MATSVLSGFLSGCHARSRARHSFILASCGWIFCSASSLAKASVLASLISLRSSGCPPAFAASPALCLLLLLLLLLEEDRLLFRPLFDDFPSSAELSDPCFLLDFFLSFLLGDLDFDCFLSLEDEAEELPDELPEPFFASSFFTPAMAREPAWGDQERRGACRAPLPNAI